MQVVAVDWSGDATERGQRDRIWAATATDGHLTDLVGGRTRAQVVGWLAGLASGGGGVVVGLDFSFSFPAWFVQSLGAADVAGLWDVVAERGEAWLARCEPPFWGRPGTRRPAGTELYRRTESAIEPVAGVAPKSTFQIGGAGAVGTGSIRGMPFLRELRRAGFSIWPFDQAGPATVVEIWPRVLTGPVRKSDRSARERYLSGLARPGLPERLRAVAVSGEDAFDAAVSALEMSRHGEELSRLAPAADARSRLEGEVWLPRPRHVESVLSI